MLKKLVLFFTVLFGGFLACFAAVYTLHVWLLVNQLPFCREAAYAWMMGELGTSVCVEGDISNGVPRTGYEGPLSAISGLPVPYPVRYFFGYDPNYFGGRWHGGVDMPCPVGTPIQATMGGSVSYAGWSDAGYGYLVVVENQGIQTFYAHASELVVSPGQVVEAGDVVALSGSTGYSTGPHVHYEVRVDGTPVDPLTAVLPGSEGGPE
jgi:murein DD-endopeptidase MepM/ murein hydrolase activator NlpD